MVERYLGGGGQEGLHAACLHQAPLLYWALALDLSIELPEPLCMHMQRTHTHADPTQAYTIQVHTHVLSLHTSTAHTCAYIRTQVQPTAHTA